MANRQMLYAAVGGLAILGVATRPSAGVDCGSAYASFLERLGQRVDTITGGRLASLNRSALRIFDACDTGHISRPDSMFRNLERSG